MSAEVAVTNTVPDAQELKNNIVVKLPHEFVNVYADRVNTDLVLGSTEIGIIAVEDTSTSSKTQTTLTSIDLATNRLYSRCLMFNCNLGCTISNIKTLENMDLIASSCVQTPGKTYEYFYKHKGTDDATRKTAKWQPAGALNTFKGGNGCPVSGPAFGFCQNIVNACYNSIKLAHGATSTSLTRDYTTRNLEVDCSKYEYDFCKNHYDGMLIGDLSNNCQYILPDELTTYGLQFPDGASASIQYGTYNKDISLSYNSIYPTYKDLENDPTNALSSLNRGQIFKKPGVAYNQTATGQDFLKNKKLKSQNFIINPNTGVKATNGEETDLLYWVKTVDGYHFPSNVENAQALYDMGYPRYCIEWKATGILGVETKVVGDKITHTFILEPVGQALNVAIRVPDLQIPLYNPIAEAEAKTTFTNSGKLVCTMNKNKLATELIRTHFDFESHFTNEIYGDGMAIQMDTVGCRLILKQSHNPLLQGFVNPVCVIPYYDLNQMSMTQKKTSTSNILRFNIVNSKLTQCPKYLRISLDKKNAKINKIVMKYKNGNDVLGSISMNDFYNNTKANGISQYNNHDNNINAYPNMWKKPNKNAKIMNGGNGTILFLEFGKDIPTMDPHLMPGLQEILSITIELEVEYNGEYGEDLSAWVEFLSLSYYSIANNASTDIAFGIQLGQLASAYKKLIADINSKSIYVSARRFIGGAIEGAQKATSSIGKRFSAQKAQPAVLNSRPSAGPSAKPVQGQTLSNLRW